MLSTCFSFHCHEWRFSFRLADVFLIHINAVEKPASYGAAVALTRQGRRGAQEKQESLLWRKSPSPK